MSTTIKLSFILSNNTYGSTYESTYMDKCTIVIANSKKHELKLTETKIKHDIILELLEDYTTQFVSDNNRIELKIPKNKSLLPKIKKLTLDTPYDFYGNLYFPIKNNGENFRFIINDIPHVIVIENTKRLTMVPEIWLLHQSTYEKYCKKTNKF